MSAVSAVCLLCLLCLLARSNTDLNDPSCSCSSAMAGGGIGPMLSASMIAVQRRNEDLSLFHQIRDEGASIEELAMGLHLLEKTWEHTGAEDWLKIEEELLTEISGLAAAARELDLRMRSLRIISL